MTREKTSKEYHIEELGLKRDNLIIKVINNLYAGRISNLFWSSNRGLCIGEVMPNKYLSKQKMWYHPPKDVNDVKKVIMHDIHAIAKVFNEKCPENLNILEYLIEKINEGWVYKTETEIEEDIKEIKERCASILMLLTIEAGNQ